MKQEQINKLEKLSSIVKNYNDKKQLLDNDKVLSNGYYRDYFTANNTTKYKPKFNFSMLIILFCSLGLPALCTLRDINFATIIFLFAFLIGIVVLFICYKKSVSHWIKIKSKYNQDIQECNEIVNNLLTQMQEYKDIMLGVDMLEVVRSIAEAIEIYKNQKNNINKQGKIVSDLTSIIINQQKLELKRINLKNAQNIKYIKCKYCGITNNSNYSKCQNCGAILDDN